MSISNATENAILNLLYSATAFANYADNASASPETNISVALHTADPGEAGNMGTSEITYTSYARVSKLRSTGWTSSTAGSINPATQIDFPAGTGGSGTAQFFSTGKASGGATALILFSGGITPSIVCGDAVTPHLTVASSIQLD